MKIAYIILLIIIILSLIGCTQSETGTIPRTVTYTHKITITSTATITRPPISFNISTSPKASTTVAKISPINWTNISNGYKETSFDLPVQTLCTLNIYIDKSQKIEYSWKSNQRVADWYVIPNGNIRVASYIGGLLIPPVDLNGVKTGKSELVKVEGASMELYPQIGDTYTISAAMDGFTIPGYYTLCFYSPADSKSPITNIIFNTAYHHNNIEFHFRCFEITKI
jgi:hypothetical protein